MSIFVAATAKSGRRNFLVYNKENNCKYYKKHGKNHYKTNDQDTS